MEARQQLAERQADKATAHCLSLRGLTQGPTDQANRRKLLRDKLQSSRSRNKAVLASSSFKVPAAKAEDSTGHSDEKHAPSRGEKQPSINASELSWTSLNAAVGSRTSSKALTKPQTLTAAASKPQSRRPPARSHQTPRPHQSDVEPTTAVFALQRQQCLAGMPDILHDSCGHLGGCKTCRSQRRQYTDFIQFIVQSEARAASEVTATKQELSQLQRRIDELKAEKMVMSEQLRRSKCQLEDSYTRNEVFRLDAVRESQSGDATLEHYRGALALGFALRETVRGRTVYQVLVSWRVQMLCCLQASTTAQQQQQRCISMAAHCLQRWVVRPLMALAHASVTAWLAALRENRQMELRLAQWNMSRMVTIQAEEAQRNQQSFQAVRHVKRALQRWSQQTVYRAVAYWHRCTQQSLTQLQIESCTKRALQMERLRAQQQRQLERLESSSVQGFSQRPPNASPAREQPDIDRLQSLTLSELTQKE